MLLVNFAAWDPQKFYHTLNDLRTTRSQYADARITFKELKNGPPVEAPIQIRLIGDDLRAMTEFSYKVEELISKTEGTIDVFLLPGTSFVGQAMIPTIKTVEETAMGKVWIDHCGDNQLQISVNSTGTDKPASPQATIPFDVASFFAKGPVYAGFAASSRRGSNQDILNWRLEQSCGNG